VSSPQEREEALFRAAIELRSGLERQAFLDQACGADVPMRQRLEALVAAHDQPGDPLSLPPESLHSSLKLDFSHLPPAEGVGQMIGRYKLLEKLGEGGCGIVYVAEQTEPVRRRVALKVIKLGMDTREVIARFEAERQALALMDHPNIARVLDAGATDTGRPFFVMELVRGIKLTQYCDQNKLAMSQRLELFIKVCQAIQHAHQKGIIHRDIKPSNILVTLHDGVPVPKVIDFGIAKAIEGRLTDATVYTQFHHFVGTPAYMSPEQAEMSGLDIDTRSDIYSLGVLLYELLTGQTPFDGKKLVSMGVDAMRKTIREAEPSRPSLKLATLEDAELTTTAQRRASDPPRLIYMLRGDLDWIVMKCLEKDRTRRYETANGLAAEIRRHLACEPIVARPPSTVYRLQKAFRRHRVASLATAAVGIALLAGLTASLWEAFRATRAESMASKRLTEAEAVSTFLTEVFQSPDPARDGRTVTVAETLDTAAKRIESDLAGQPLRRAQLQATLGRTYFSLGLSGDAIPLLKKARDYYFAALGRDSRDTLLVTHHLGLAYCEAGRPEEAIPLQEELLVRQRRINGAESPEAILTLMALGNSYAGARRDKDALEVREDALRLSRKVNGLNHPDTVRAMHGLALCYSSADALKLREETYALSCKVNGPEHPATLRAAINLEISYSAQGRDEDLLKLLEVMVPLSFKLNGPDNRHTRRSLEKLERAYYAAGRWQDALQLKTDYARWDPKELNAELLVVQAWFGRSTDYAASCRRLLKFAEGTQVPTTAERAAKACLLLPSDDHALLESARGLARKAVELGTEHQFLGWFQLALGMAEFRLGNYRAADKALLAAERMAPLNSGFFRTMVLFRQGQAGDARKLFEATVSRMRPLPDDDQNPLASGASGDDMIVWLAYREAATMLGVEPAGVRPVAAWVAGLKQEFAANPVDSIRSLQLALVFLWQGNTAEHDALCRQTFDVLSGASDPAVCDRAAKAYLLRSNPEPNLLKLASASAGRAMDLAQPGDSNLPWFRTAAGMAAYREGRFAEAETLLSSAVANPLHENQRRLALVFRAMARARAGRGEEARADMVKLAKLNLAWPDPAKMSPIVRDQDQLAVRLAYHEASALMKPISTATNP
jgi:serine/threonine protein kinase/tetratricopeptide (TPR) repeat protein